MMKRILISTVAAVLLLLPITAQSKELRLLTWVGYAPKELVDKFERETGYKVLVTHSNNEEIIARLIATRGAGFDLAQPSQDRVVSGQQAGNIYQPMDYSRIDESLFIPSMLEVVKTNTAIDGKSYAVPFCWGTSALIINNKQVQDAGSFLDLFNPEYKGRISYRLKRPIIVATAFALGYDPFSLYDNPEEYQKMLDKVTEKLIEGKPLVNNYWANGTALLASLRSGEVHIAKGWDSAAFRLHQENPNIDFVAPDTGPLGWIDTFVIPAKAENLDAAYAWINFMLRPENAAVFTNNENIATASKDAMNHVNDEIKADFDRCLPPAVIDNIKWYPPLSAELEAMELKALDRVRAAK
jgi:spermidine/putrescine transport system substrate-binding protein